MANFLLNPEIIRYFLGKDLRTSSPRCRKSEISEGEPRGVLGEALEPFKVPPKPLLGL